jgi:hypothetical protein
MRAFLLNRWTLAYNGSTKAAALLSRSPESNEKNLMPTYTITAIIKSTVPLKSKFELCKGLEDELHLYCVDFESLEIEKDDREFKYETVIVFKNNFFKKVAKNQDFESKITQTAIALRKLVPHSEIEITVRLERTWKAHQTISW